MVLDSATTKIMRIVLNVSQIKKNTFISAVYSAYGKTSQT